MNTQEKEKSQKIIVITLQSIDLAVQKAVKAKDEYRDRLEKLFSHGTETYSTQYLEKEVEKIKGEIITTMQSSYAGVVKLLEDLRTYIHDRDSVLDLSNPALQTGLNLIQTIGASLTYEEALKINANFIHDQSALKTLRSAYRAQGVPGGGGDIDAMIYDADEVIDNLKKLAYHGLLQDGSINYFASKLSKLAKLEGTTVEELPDQKGSIEAMRQAAGL